MPLSDRKVRLTDLVTAHMHQDFTRLSVQQTVGEAMRWLRKNPPQGRIIYFYVLDGDGRLQGVVPTRRLVLQAPETPLAEIMIREVITLPGTATMREACEFFVQHRLLAFPVVDHDGRLLGVVDMESYRHEIGEIERAEGRDVLFQLLGVHVAGDRQETPLRAFRDRFPWLGANLAAGILAALLSGIFEDTLKAAVALAFFIPVVLNLAESVSSQSVSLTLQLLHGRPPAWRDMLKKLRQETLTGLLLGMGSGAVIAAVAFVWLGRGSVALCLIVGITGGVAGAAVFGILVPYVLRLFHLEPRVAAGPICLAAADVWTILLYLSLARWLLG